MKAKRFPILTLVAAVGAALVVAASPPAARAGTIEGKVTYTGTPPKMQPIDMAKQPECAKMYNPPLRMQNVVTGPGNSLQYVVVYISAGAAPSPTPTKPVRVDQKGCMYVPHVVAMQAGQTLEIYTDDPFAHNIHPVPKANPEWNKSQPPGAPPIITKWDKAEFIEVKCNIHPWMHGYHAVLNTSHYAITDENGAYSLKGLPPGKYTITAWQEQYSWQSQDVTIKGTETETVNFVFKVKPYLY